MQQGFGVPRELNFDIRARWNCDFSLTLWDRIVTVKGVITSIARYLFNIVINLLQQVTQHFTIGYIISSYHRAQNL